MQFPEYQAFRTYNCLTDMAMGTVTEVQMPVGTFSFLSSQSGPRRLRGPIQPRSNDMASLPRYGSHWTDFHEI